MTPELIGIRRGALELEDLAGLGRDCRGMDPGRPVVALSDGTLILWTLEGKPDDFKQAMLDRYRQAFECLRSHTVPVAGYISDPRSSDVVNALRVGLCPAERVDCDRCPYSPADGLLPCEKVAGVTDAILFSRMLLPGERSQVFSSSSLVLDDYPPEQRISFCYINVGSEVARLEFPQWVADDGYLDLMAATALDQAQKGQGYPVVLTEAHERAVIRGPERESFYRLLEETMIQRGVKVAVSRKSLGKRSVFV